MRSFPLLRFRTLVGRATFFVALLVVTGVLFVYGTPVFAQGDFGIAAVDSQIGLSGTSIVVILLNVIRILLGFLGLVLVTIVIYAGYTIMTSAGNEEKVEKGKTILKNAVIGTGIILFSFIIVQFVMNILLDVTGARPNIQEPPGIETFAGVGSLGKEPQSHYPLPNQTDVYRNTKIVITFADSIDPSSIIDNTNGSCWGPNNIATTTCTSDAVPYYGDCIEGICDTLNTDTIQVHKLTAKGGQEDGDVMTLDAMVAYENENEARTFVFKLQNGELFGNEETDQWHEVVITNDVRNVRGDDIFDNLGGVPYKWEFETNTEVDLTPPYVVDVSPNPGEVVTKNRMLKITFNEAVDPMTVQGILGSDSSFSNILIGVTRDVVSPPTPAVPTADQDGDDTVYEPAWVKTLNSGGSQVPQKLVYDAATQIIYTAINGLGVLKIDVQNSSTASFVGVLQGEFYDGYDANAFVDMVLDGQYLYIISNGGDSTRRALHIVDKNTLKNEGVLDGLTTPNSIAVSGGYAYIADDVDGVRVIDVTDPSNPTEIQDASFTTPAQGAVQLEIAGDTLVVGSYGNNVEMSIVDISTPTTPNIIANGGGSLVENDIAIYQDYIYAGDSAGILRIIDATAPTDGFTAAQFNVDQRAYGVAGGSVRSITVEDDLLIVGQHAATKVFRIANDPFNPEFLFTYAGEGDAPFVLDNRRPIVRVNDHLFIGQIGKGIYIVDIVAASDVDDQPAEGETFSSIVEVSGQWKISNAYRTIEFLSDTPCGNNAVNSCGEPIYCLPTTCADYDKTCTASYSVLARTATTKEPNTRSFASANLFDGVVDMADNALDSANNLDSTQSVIPGSHDFPTPHTKPPVVGNIKNISTEELQADNYWWNFTVINDVDSTSPYIHTVSPGIDTPGVSQLAPVKVLFSKEMSSLSFSQVDIVEYPGTGVGMGIVPLSEDKEVDEITDTATSTVTKTTLTLKHPARPFGPGATDYWYFVDVPGEVRAMNQFCLYPGRGPYSAEPHGGDSDPACEVTYDEDWNITSVSASCRPGDIKITSSTDTGCISTHTGLLQVVGDTRTCIEQLSDPAVSPSVFVE